MRVHGEKHITRRDLHIGKDYHDFKIYLCEDFSGLCGYCGKNSQYLPYNYEIDHFVPRAIAPERENDYQNLVFACRRCNRIKSSKWPTKDKNIANDGRIGFVDPATAEYDKHLTRNEEGTIVYKTELGKSIYKQLHFDLRRTDIFWNIELLNQLEEKLERLNEENKLTVDEMKFYIQLNQKLKKIQQMLAAQGE